MAKKIRSQPEALQREPTAEEWNALVTYVMGEKPDVELAVILLLCTTPSGQAYLEEARRLRPALGATIDLDEIVSTHNADQLLDRLLAEPRCGFDRDFYVWKDIWCDASVGSSPVYSFVIELAKKREAEATDEKLRERLREVRAAVEREFEFEQYAEWRNEEVTKNPKL